MNVYNTLIIGSGYSSIGYATACPNTVICEEHQICDTHFYLPLRSFRYKYYSPKTKEGSKLLNIFDSLSLFKDNEQNTNGFECAFCKYVIEKQLNLLLKCRVIHKERRSDGIYDVIVQTNEGLTHLLAKKILNVTSSSMKKNFTVLFISDDIEKASKKLLGAFDSAKIEPAFYKGRYALHVSADGVDENGIKLAIYEKWKALDIDAKILYMAPVFYAENGSDGLCDDNYQNPIEAFESGYFYAKETNR